MFRTARITIPLILALAILPVPSYAATRAQFHDDMRRLWEDHVTWTRLYIVSATAGLPDLQVTTQRLLRNQDDIGNAVAAFYGRDAGNKLTGLLKEHIMIAGSLVGAAKAGDTAKVNAENARWHENADQIAAFLHGANPKYWPLATLQSAMNGHLQQTLDEATHRLKGDYAAETADYDRVVAHILMMADVLSDGIIKQFPAKFSEGKK